MIEFQDISLSLDGKMIFDRFSASIEKGDKVSISGGSGRGKTSLINIILGYLQPDDGEICIDGKPLAQNIQEARNKIAWVPQNVNLPAKNGNELIELMQLSGGKKLIAHYLQELGLEEKVLIKDFEKVSIGQKQRIVISIVLALQKPILLLDEPTASLDEKSIHRLIRVIRGLHASTIISATHNPLWLQHSDKVIEL
jgi:ABC-type multidrug transport system ATPase subunit